MPEQLRGNAEDVIGEKNNGRTVEVECAESIKIESGILSEIEKNIMNEESSEDGDDNVPPKKLKTDGKQKEMFSGLMTLLIRVFIFKESLKTPQLITPVEKKFDLVKDGAMEAEVRAAKERAMVPLDVRVKSFKEMLKEKEVKKSQNYKN